MNSLKTLGALVAIGLLSGCSASEEAMSDSVGSAAEAPSYSSMEADMSVARSSQDGRAAESAMSVLLKNRHVIRTADVEVKVEDAEKAEQTAQQIISAADGFVANSSTTGLGGSDPSVTMTIRVPVAEFEDSLNKLASLGVLQNKSLSSDDVTGQIVDLDARLKTLRAKEEAYVGMLKKVSSTADVVTMQDTISNVRTEIEQIMGQRQQLSAQAKFSTINLTLSQKTSLVPPVKDQDWTNAAWADASSSFGEILRGFGTVGIWILTFAPVWLPLVALFIGGIWWLRKISTPSA